MQLTIAFNGNIHCEDIKLQDNHVVTGTRICSHDSICKYDAKISQDDNTILAEFRNRVLPDSHIIATITTRDPRGNSNYIKYLWKVCN